MSGSLQVQALGQAQSAQTLVTPTRWGVLRRKCACSGHSGSECQDCREERQAHLRRSGDGRSAPAEVPPVVYDVLRGPGEPLDTTTRAFMESRLGHDFSRVRLHTGPAAAQSAHSVGALAFAVGPHVVLGGQAHARSGANGLALLAHELAHTVQHDGTAIGHRLAIGAPDDRAEYEADRMAAGILDPRDARQVEPSREPAVLRRVPEDAKPLHTDRARLDEPSKGKGAKIIVLRQLFACQCRSVPDARSGVFWNPNINAFAIAYRHCRGGVTSDVYGEVQSNVSAFLAGGPPPTGVARVGFEINVVGRSVGGRVLLEVLGNNVPGGQGVGGRAQVVFESGRWRAYLTTDFLHGLGANPGDTLNFDLGAKLGSVSVEVQISNVLSQAPRGSGAACVDLGGGGARLCGTLSGGGGTGVTPGIDIRGSFGGPAVHPIKCYQCWCPPPTPRFTCFLDIPPGEKPVTRYEDVELPGEHRYYFRLDDTAISRDAALQGRSRADIAEVAREVADGGHVVSISAYASPEAPEAHNQTLSANRAKTLSELVRSTLPSGTPLPAPSAGGELLGRRPASVPTSRLGDFVRRSGFRSAEDISVFLLGDEIPQGELSDQFVSLFQALPDPADRLAVFGVAPDDPLAKPLLGAIGEFLRRPRAGARPWERVFAQLRVGVVRTSRTKRKAMQGTEPTEGSLTELDEPDCKAQGAAAERRGLLPPVPQELRSPRRGREDRDVECAIEVRPEDKRGGCSYEIPAGARLSPSAPARAPQPFP